MKFTEIQILIVKIALGIMFAEYTGESMGGLTSDFQYPNSWLSGSFLILFFPSLAVLIMQWIILSEHLPKWWVLTGCVGCIRSAFLIDRTASFISYLFSYREILRYLIMGLFVAIPQGLLLKGGLRYVWILGNGLGWMLIQVFSKAFSVLDATYPKVYYVAPPIFMILIRVVGIFSLGLLLGACLQKIVNETK